jgi:hypothetical protein
MDAMYRHGWFLSPIKVNDTKKLRRYRNDVI